MVNCVKTWWYMYTGMVTCIGGSALPTRVHPSSSEMAALPLAPAPQSKVIDPRYVQKACIPLLLMGFMDLFPSFVDLILDNNTDIF